MRYQLARLNSDISGDIELPASKSISNRLLILDSLASGKGELKNLSDSDDTRILLDALESDDPEVNVGHAGTAMRFLTAYFSIGNRERILSGSARMQNRPIGRLVDALKSMGAQISYTGKEGYPPLRIRGEKLSGGRINIDSSISSQFISALMMVGPSLERGLVIRLENEVVSSSYISLTANLMNEYGIGVHFSGNTIRIPHAEYPAISHTVEADWSAASYWYAMVAMSPGADLKLSGLKQGSYQGDSVLPGMFLQFGVETKFSAEGIRLKRVVSPDTAFEFDFRDNPDLAQTMVVLCTMTGRPFHFSGTQTLQIKETDRIAALGNELRKLGIQISFDPGGKWISWDGCREEPDSPRVTVKTYQDHRMAMAFAPAAIRFPGLVIEDAEVVSKSYPGFWSDLARVGFEISEI